MNGLKRALTLLMSYKRTFTAKDPAIGLMDRDKKRVLDDLIRKYILDDPVAYTNNVVDVNATLINVGKQRLAIQIVRKVYGSEDELRAAIEQANQPQDHE